MSAPVTVSGGEIRTPAGSAPVLPVLMVGAGGYLLWFGVKYWRGTGPAVWPSYPVKSVLQGKGVPAPEPATPAAETVAIYEAGIGGGAAGPGGGPVSGPAVAQDALRYRGHCYHFGGAPGVDGSGCWDCSSFVNWVIGHDMGQPIPGVKGQYDGASHGPVVASWITWPGIQHVAACQAGDIVAWGPNAHMGIAISPSEMISALNPALGTRVTPIGSAHAGPPVFLRLKSAAVPNPRGNPHGMARLLLGRFGWGDGQMAPLDSLWAGESHWQPDARNPQSGALGIAQALGHGQADTAGTLGNEYGAQYGLTAAEARAANSGDALQQIRWGLGYIHAVYGSPAAAYAAWRSRSPHWY